MKLKQTLLSFAALTAVSVGIQSASAAAIIGAPITLAQTSKVSVTFLGGDAGYRDILGLVGGPSLIFDNKVTPLNTTFDLGTFAGGTTLTFSLKVLNTGLTFFSGPAGLNIDNVAHAGVDGNVVGFEDLRGGGDKDYNDLRFSYLATAVPEPAQWAMLVGGLMMAGGLLRRRPKMQQVSA